MTRLFWRFSPILGKILAQKGAIWCDKCHCYHGSGINKGTFLDAIIPPSVHSVEYCKISVKLFWNSKKYIVSMKLMEITAECPQN